MKDRRDKVIAVIDVESVHSDEDISMPDVIVVVQAFGEGQRAQVYVCGGLDQQIQTHLIKMGQDFVEEKNLNIKKHIKTEQILEKKEEVTNDKS